MQNRLQHLLELRRQPILPTGCPDTMRFEQNVMPTRNDTGDNMRDLLELQCFSAQDATYTRNEPVLGGDLPRPSTRHGSYSHENEFVSSHANIDSSVCASFTSSLHNTHNISDVLLSDVSPQFADDGAGSNTVEHCELREETDVNKFCPGQQNNPQYRSCKANGNSRVLWARESEHIDPNILDRPKTAKILLQSRESCASLPILSPYPQQSHVSLAENRFFEDLPTDDCNETPTPSVSTTTETGVLWAHSSTHVSEIVRPHTSNPYQTTFFCGASPKNANFNDEHSSGEIVWSHDDNLYDLRQDLEIQKIKFAALESKLSLILEFLSQNENWKATKGANAAFSSDLPHTYSVSPRSTDCDPLPSTKTTRSARPSTARHVSKHSESVGYSEHNCTQPIPMDTLPLRARPGFVQSSDQKMKDTEMESFSYLSNDNPSTQVDSVSSGNDFGAEAVYHALLREDQKIPHTSSLLSKGTFIKFYHRCQLPGIVGLTSDRSIRDILSKYTSAGEHNLNYDQFMVLYLQQIRV